MVTGQPWLQLTHPYKAGREPSFLLINLAPPPVLVGGVQHLDDVTGLKRQLPVRHGHMVPYRLSVDDWTSTYQLEKSEGKTGYILCLILITRSHCCGNTSETAWAALQTLTNKYGSTWSKTAYKSNLKVIVIQYSASFWPRFVWILVVKPTQITNGCKYTPSKPGPTGSLGIANRTTQ